MANSTRYRPRPKHRIYIAQDFYGASFQRIDRINGLIEKFATAGMDVTERSLFYAEVSAGHIVNSSDQAQKLSELITNARLAGYIPMDAIDDPTRTLNERSSWTGPEALLADAARDYSRRRWASQRVLVEIFVEKDAVVGYALPAATKWFLPLYSCRGYTSWPGVHDASVRYARALADGKLVIVMHLGDHDPSGIGMTQDIAGRLWVLMRLGSDRPTLEQALKIGTWDAVAAIMDAQPLTRQEYEDQKRELFRYGKRRCEVETPWPGRLIVERIALNGDQTDDLPEQPLKTKNGKDSDSRAPSYHDYKVGAGMGNTGRSWELDALPVIGEPTAIGDLIDEAVEPLIDKDAWAEAERAEGTETARLGRLPDHWGSFWDERGPRRGSPATTHLPKSGTARISSSARAPHHETPRRDPPRPPARWKAGTE